MGNIVLLDDLTINKIAAGEVIERPASVIKEMVENSIDAGANNITVEIKNGGISYIRVSDNGKGIAPDDLEIAFERHATSKIRKAEDLNVVTSMGFRGEALASIAAIANVELTSKTESQDTGYKITVEAGNVLDKQEVGCQTGTTIVVQNLFFNTPVRYKFLKKDYTEAGYIEDVITRIALVNPNIAIKLINTGKTVIQTNGNGDMKSVIYSIYGKDVATGILPVDYTYEDIEITGVIGKPEIARSNRSNQLFFVNKRHIKDKILTAATEQAFKGLIPIGKYGFVVLNININPAKVDVNVHPAKLEVRFEEENKIFQSIYHAIKNTLLESELVANTERATDKIDEQKDETSKGLFDFRKNETKRIEQYNDEESKIKTNVAQEEQKNVTKNVFSAFNIGTGGPVNTADILEQLKKMKEDLQKQIEDDKAETNSENEIYSEELQEKNNQAQEISDQENSNNEEQKETSDQENINGEELKENLEQENSNNEESKETSNQEIINNEEQNIEKIEGEPEENNIENQEKNDGGLEENNIENQEKTESKPEEKLEKINEQIKQLESIKYDEGNTVDFNTMYEKLFGTKPIGTSTDVEEQEQEKEEKQNTAADLIKDNLSVFEQSEEYKKPIYKFIGIAFNTYIIIEMDKEMYIIDQHAAHERIMYEKVKRNYYSEKTKDSQMLLLPDVITLTHKEMEIAKDNMDMFEKAGFSLEEFGENTIKLTGVPTVCLDIDNKELFLETLDEINTVARTAKQEKEEKFIATVACKAAVKANMVLDKAEVENLMDRLLELPNPFTCPHGRPTAIKMSKYDIERKFARK